jgi:hypothetical protein
LNDFGDNASTGRPDELDIAERSGGDEIGNGNWKSDDGFGGALVSELAAFGRLQRGHVVQQRGRGHIEVAIHNRVD